MSPPRVKNPSAMDIHPRTLHLWWARRPLAACRAVLFAALVDDPDSDPSFRRADGGVDEQRAGLRRAELFDLIEKLVRWENSNDESVLNAARAEIAELTKLLKSGEPNDSEFKERSWLCFGLLECQGVRYLVHTNGRLRRHSRTVSFLDMLSNAG